MRQAGSVSDGVDVHPRNSRRAAACRRTVERSSSGRAARTTVVPLGVAAERPVRDLLGETGPGQCRARGWTRSPDGGLRGGDLIGQRLRARPQLPVVASARTSTGPSWSCGGATVTVVVSGVVVARGGRGARGDRRAHPRRRRHCSPPRGSRPARRPTARCTSTTHPRGGRCHGTARATSAISIARYTWGKVSPGRLSPPSAARRPAPPRAAGAARRARPRPRSAARWWPTSCSAVLQCTNPSARRLGGSIEPSPGTPPTRPGSRGGAAPARLTGPPA